MLDIMDVKCIVPARPAPKSATLTIGASRESDLSATCSKYLQRKTLLSDEF